MATSETKYWGLLDYTEDSVIDFPAGIPGFEQEQQFILVEQQALDPLVFLQSLATPALCFLALHVRVVCPDYKFRMSEEDLEVLGIPGTRQPPIGPDLACLTLIHIEEKDITANLLAPIVIHVPARRGMQAILAGTDYSHQHRIDLVEAPVCV
jgi:flagellar assembly factor FliW